MCGRKLPASRPVIFLTLPWDTTTLFHADKYKVSLQFTAINVTNRVALHNFLSTFSGTHYVTPRTLRQSWDSPSEARSSQVRLKQKRPRPEAAFACHRLLSGEGGRRNVFLNHLDPHVRFETLTRCLRNLGNGPASSCLRIMSLWLEDGKASPWKHSRLKRQNKSSAPDPV
jgi:hypothetical protein